MITRVEIDGYKSFLDFELDIRPCTVLMGANGAGKSNLLDALDLVRRSVVQGDLDSVLGSEPRFATRGLFHRADSEEGTYLAEHLSIELGLIVPSADGPLPLVVRLEAQREGEPPGPVDAVLRPGRSAVRVSGARETAWMDRLGLPADLRAALVAAREGFVRRTGTDWAPLVGHAVPVPEEGELDVLADVLQDSQPGGRGAGELLGLLWRECAAWEPVSLAPRAMRTPFSGSEKTPLLSDGRNVAAVLHRLSGEQDGGPFHEIQADLAALIPGAYRLRTVFEERRGEYDFDVLFRNAGWVSPPELSDGTLRVLALLAAWYDDRRSGLLAVEEVENGLHPTRVGELVRRLRRDAEEYSDMAEREAPVGAGFRQLLLTTHSPALLAALRNDSSGSLVFLEQSSRIAPHQSAVSPVTSARPVREPLPDEGPHDTISSADVGRILEHIGQGAA